MGAWFNQERFDLNGTSTKELIEWARDHVDTARRLAGMDHPPRSPDDMRQEARRAVDFLFSDKAAALVLKETGQARETLLSALDSKKFETVLSGLDQAAHRGSEREMPAAAALAGPSIEAAARFNAAFQRSGAATAGEERRPANAEDIAAARDRMTAANNEATALLREGAPRVPTMRAVDQAIDAADAYWQAAAQAGAKLASAEPKRAENQDRPEQGPEHARGKAIAR